MKLLGNKVNSGMINRFDEFCFWFTTIDLLFLPYFPLISVSFSVPIVVLWLIINIYKINRGLEARIYVLVVLCMCLSTMISLVYRGNVRWETSFGTSVKRFFQLAICLGYYFFIKSFFKQGRWIYLQFYSLLFLL